MAEVKQRIQAQGQMLGNRWPGWINNRNPVVPCGRRFNENQTPALRKPPRSFMKNSTITRRSAPPQGVPTLDNVAAAQRQTPYPAFAVGHWLVVTGLSSTQAQVADSSGSHIQTLSLQRFHTLLTGIGVIAWQGMLSLPKEG